VVWCLRADASSSSATQFSLFGGGGVVERLDLQRQPTATQTTKSPSLTLKVLSVGHLARSVSSACPSRCASSCCKAQSNMLQLQNAISQFQPTLDHLFWSSANQPSVVCGRVIGTGVVLASFVFARSPRLASFVFARSFSSVVA
jgi:hypothetical protein